MKRFALIAIFCLTAVLCAACMPEDEVEDSYIEQSENVLKSRLSACYGLEEGSYTAKVVSVDTNPNVNPSQGVVWKVKRGETEFSVFMCGDYRDGYEDKDIRSDRYASEFTRYVVKEAERRIDENGALGELPYTVSFELYGDYYVKAPMYIPINVSLVGFTDFLKEMLERSPYDGFKMIIHVYAEEMIYPTQEQMQKLQEAFPACSWTILGYNSKPGSETEENCIGSVHYYYGRAGYGEGDDWYYRKY